ncbi:MAG: helix-turn-helix transcriptional regulator [Azonexus sp.]|nr:helix-turn-helix transcriptional regulator [Azonexus sp.]
MLRELLSTERERNGLTQVDVANRLKKPQSYVSKYERGERRLDVVEFVDVTRALGMDPLAVLKSLIDRMS